MIPDELRATYLAWIRRAAPFMALPIVLTAIVQAAAASRWWNAGPPPAGAVRYLFIAVAAAGVVSGRATRAREVVGRGLDAAALRSLSWRLLVFSLAPAVIGVVLAMMTRSVYDYYLLLVVTLVAVVLLFPRYDQWVLWSSPATKAEE